MSRYRFPLFVLVLVMVSCSAFAARLTTKDIVDALRRSDDGHPANFSGQDLSNLDLSGIDFKRADLSRANLFGADLSDANLSNAKLTGANLDRVTIIRTNFTNADMSGITMILPAAFSTFDAIPAEAPILAGADLRKATIIAKLAWADMRGAKLAGAMFNQGDHYKRAQGAHSVYSDLTGCKLNGADLSNARIGGTLLSMADLSGANLTGADFAHSDLTSANLNGATISGADFTSADVSGATLTALRGRELAQGLIQGLR